jgi:hypothetical protein
MSDREAEPLKIKPIGTILIVAALGLLLAVIIGSLAFFVLRITEVVASVDASGDATISVPSDGVYAFMAADDGTAQVGNLTFTVEQNPAPSPTDQFTISHAQDIPFQPASVGAWLEIDGSRFRVLGTMDLDAGDHTINVSGPSVAFPMTIRRDGIDMGRGVLITAAIVAQIPVAMLIAFGVFFAAEASPFLGEAVSFFSTTDDDNNPQPFRVVAKQITGAVYWVFQTYGDLRPTKRLVTGEMLGWDMVGTAVIFLGAWTSALGALAVYIFRRRELATYSGR